VNDAAAIRGVLTTVQDPCSRMLGRPVSIVDLGLVESVSVDGDRVAVELVTTVPNCIMFCDIAASTREAVRQLDASLVVDVRLRTDLQWTRERADPAAAP